ncbi:MAG: diacylglycerol kinase [Flavobacteriales bacterium]|nr:MAG: diacylglycerol kinase [Flavobacteriales bacterium]
MIIIIAAIGKNRALGRDNQLLWHLPNDLKRFKKITSGHDVIMGRKTLESLGKPLPNRHNIVITRNKKFHAPGCTIVHSLKEGIEKGSGKNLYILGGGEIYKQAIGIADILDLTLVDATPKADTFFPTIDPSIWKEISRESYPADENHKFNYSFVKYVRHH